MVMIKKGSIIVLLGMIMIVLFSMSVTAEVTDEDLRDGIVAYWTLDDLQESTGNYSELLEQGTPDNVDGKINNSYNFDGSEWLYSDIIDPDNYNDGLSYCAWFHTTYTSENQYIFSHPETGYYGNIFASISDDGTLHYRFGTGDSSTEYSGISVPNVRDGEWHHICMMHNTTHNYLYLDGEREHIDESTRSLANNDNRFGIGMYWKEQTDNWNFVGKIDEVGIWNKALTPSEMTQLYDRQSNNLLGSQYDFTSTEEVVLNASITYPVNNQNYSYVPTINYTVENEQADNCTLFCNNENIGTQYNVSIGRHNFGYYEQCNQYGDNTAELSCETTDTTSTDSVNYSVLHESDINLSFYNKTNFNKRVFDELEYFQIRINYTYLHNDSTITDGGCIVDVNNYTRQYYENLTNFNICGTASCDYNPTFNANNIIVNNTNAVRDFIHFDTCYNNADDNLSVELNCNGNSKNFQVDRTQAGVCPNYNHVILKDDVCKNYTEYNVSFTYDGSFATRYNIDHIHVDRQFQQRNVTTVYNETTKLYNSKFYAYTTEGEFSNDAVCSVDNKDSLINTQSANVTIENVAPKVYLDQISTNNNVYNYTDSVVIEYASGLFNFDYRIEDTNLDNVSAVFYDFDDNIVYEENNVNILNTPDKTFLDYTDENEYKLKLTAYDTGGLSTTKNFTFNVNDIITPDITALVPDTLFLNTTTIYRSDDLEFDIQYTDEALYIANLSFYLDDGTILYSNQTIFNTTTTSYVITDVLTNTNHTDDKILGNAYIADAHTDYDVKDRLKREIKLNKYTDQKNNDQYKIENQYFNYVIDEKTKYVSLEYKEDRVTQYIELSKQSEHINILLYPYKDNGYIYKYNDLQQFITSDYWIDFQSDNTKDVSIQKQDGYYIVTVNFNNPTKYVQFNSLGIVNERSIDFEVQLEDEPVSEEREFTGLSQTILIGILLFVWLFFLMFPFITGIPWFNILTFFISLVIGLMMYYNLPTTNHMNVMIMVLVVGIGILYLGFYFPMQYKKGRKGIFKNIRL